MVGQHGDSDVNDIERILQRLCCDIILLTVDTFIQDINFFNYTYFRESLGQRSLIYFCIVSTDLFRSVLDVRAIDVNRSTVNRSPPSGRQVTS